MIVALALLALAGWLFAFFFRLRARRLVWSVEIARRAVERSEGALARLYRSLGAGDQGTAEDAAANLHCEALALSERLDAVEASALIVESQRLALAALRGSLADAHVALRAWWDAHDWRIEDACCRRALTILEEASGTTIPTDSAAALAERAAGKVALAALRAEADALRGDLDRLRARTALACQLCGKRLTHHVEPPRVAEVADLFCTGCAWRGSLGAPQTFVVEMVAGRHAERRFMAAHKRVRLYSPPTSAPSDAAEELAAAGAALAALDGWTDATGTGLGESTLDLWGLDGSPVGTWVSVLPPAGWDSYRIVSLASGDAPLVWGPVEREEAEPPDQAAEEGSAE